jgi:hypothetical protein
MSARSTAKTLRERTGLNDLYFSSLLTANRRYVAGALALAVFLTFTAWGGLKPVSLHATMERSDTIETAFAGLVGAIITGTTLVVSINQLDLSQEIGSLGAYVEDLLENADHARRNLEDSEFGTYDVIPPALDYDYDRRTYALRRLEREYEADPADEQHDAFRDLLEALTMYGPVREYVKDLYPVGAGEALAGDPVRGGVRADRHRGDGRLRRSHDVPRTFLGFESVLWVVSAAFAVSTLPFLLFTSYVLRLATLAKQTLAKQTLAIGPLQLS